jgi:hypothetical protein
MVIVLDSRTIAGANIKISLRRLLFHANKKPQMDTDCLIGQRSFLSYKKRYLSGIHNEWSGRYLFYKKLNE